MVDIKLGPEPKVVCIPAEYKTSTSNPPSISVNMTALGQALSNPKPIMPNGTMHGSRNEVSVLVINTGGTIGMKSHGDGRPIYPCSRMSLLIRALVSNSLQGIIIVKKTTDRPTPTAVLVEASLMTCTQARC